MTAEYDENQPFVDRTTPALSHLDGHLDVATLAALQGAWSTLELAASDAAARSRAVRSRLFWESLAPGGAAAAPVAIVMDPAPTDADPGLEAEAA